MAAAAPVFTPESTAGVVLAAGRAGRFGSDKRMARLADGTPLLIQSTRLLQGVCRHIFVALKPQDRACAGALLGPLRDKVHPVFAEHAALGMGSTLADAMAAVNAFEAESPGQFAGVIVMLADLPRVRVSTLDKLVAAAAVDKVAVPCVPNGEGALQWGNPVLFGRYWFDALQALRGDRGGRELFARDESVRVLVPVADSGILRDVDRPDDLGKL